MILGIDPGITGATALYDEGLLIIADIPTLTIKKGIKSNTSIDAYSLARMIDSHSRAITHCFIESVHAMPGQGVSSCFNFGKSLGIIIGVIAANFIPMTLVSPGTWKKALGVPADKDGARARASELLPFASSNWPLKKHDGRAEAALIALWGANHQKSLQTQNNA
jgi:crossover junction endodeoxyribonuclease RuvC